MAAWLAGIVLNLLTVDPPTSYDIALRHVGLLLGALALARLASVAAPAGAEGGRDPAPRERQLTRS